MVKLIYKIVKLQDYYVCSGHAGEKLKVPELRARQMLLGCQYQ